MDYFLYSDALGRGIIVIENTLKGLLEGILMITDILLHRKTEINVVAAVRIYINTGCIVFQDKGSNIVHNEGQKGNNRSRDSAFAKLRRHIGFYRCWLVKSDVMSSNIGFFGRCDSWTPFRVS